MTDLSGEVISSGSELMLGRLVDTNGAWLSVRLNGLGIPVARHTAVGDDLPALVRAFSRAWADHQVVLVTGGLGPTEDDLTRQAAAEAFDRPLEFRPELAAMIRDIFQRRGYIFTDNNLRQAWIPRGAGVIDNPKGTAPGFYLEDERRAMLFMPGVPFEMKHMMDTWSLPFLRGKFGRRGGLIRTEILKVAGLGESGVDAVLGDLLRESVNPKMGLLAAPDLVRVVMAARGADEEEVETVIETMTARVTERLSGHLFGRGETTLAQAVAALLEQRNLRLSWLDTATGGRFAGGLSPSLPQRLWGGGTETPTRLTPEEALARLTDGRPAAGERRLEMAIVAEDDREMPSPPPGEVALLVSALVRGDDFNQGRPLTRQWSLGGPAGRALSRAASLSLFHLWRVLAGFEGQD